MKKVSKLRKVVFGGLFLGLIGFSIVGCKKEVRNTNEQKDLDKSELLESLTFDSYQENEQDVEKLNIIIFRVQLHRASRDCLRGFGFCDFEWFPDFKQKSGDSDFQVTGRSILAKKQNNQTESYIEIHLANQIPAELSDSDLELIIEESLSTTIEDNNIITIESGIYNVDRTLGEYGGYRIILND